MTQPSAAEGTAAPAPAGAAADADAAARGCLLPHPASNLAARRALWFGEPCALGIDEAGRGPVLGPMVYATVVCPASYAAAELGARGYRDSKALAEERRAALFERVAADERLAYAVDVLGADEISAAMLGRDKASLNAVAAASTARLIRAALDAGANVTEAYIDTVGDADRYAAKLSGAGSAAAAAAAALAGSDGGQRACRGGKPAL